jgi:methionyl-tRNA formyltransferase
VDVMMRRVVLIGQGPTTGSALRSLLERFDVAALVRSEHDAVSALAHRVGTSVVSDTSLSAVQATIEEAEPDGVVVASYDRILPESLLERCPFVNVHYAPLPEHRGRATVNWAVLTGSAQTAVTVHVLVPELDAGPILFQRRVPIGPADTVTELYAALDLILRRNLAEAVERHLEGDPGTPQDHAAATYGCTRLPEDGELDWTRPTAEVHALVRALTGPFPGAFTHFGGRRLTVWRACPAPSPRRWAGRVTGRVVARAAAEGWVDVLTGDGVLRLETVQLEGEPSRPAADVITTVRATLGLRTADLLERIRVLERAANTTVDPPTVAEPGSVPRH